MHEAPGAHIERLLLDPNDPLQARIMIQHFFEDVQREGVELFQPDDGKILTLRSELASNDIEVNAPAAQQEAANRLPRFRRARLLQGGLPTAFRQLSWRRS